MSSELLGSERARGRWRILRNALLSNNKPTTNDADSKRHSIHRFSGYNMLTASTLWEGARKELDERLSVIRAEASNAYSIVQYALPPTSNNVLIRQRNPQTSKLSIQQLASHHFHHGVDNTGNVCIWDAEITLAWALLQEQIQNRMHDVKSITELGVGMAGLAALTCAVVSKDLDHAHLTDGHADCVRNNEVNAVLMDTTSMHASVKVSQLLWSADNEHDDARPPPADWTLISDCTHFQEYHAALFWTLVQCTRVGGTIWMCQPNRGKSWARFCQLMDFVNGPDEGHHLLTLREQRYPALDDKHELFLKDDAYYDADVHQPRVFCLVKLRPANDHDRRQALRHMEIRDAKPL